MELSNRKERLNTTRRNFCPGLIKAGAVSLIVGLFFLNIAFTAEASASLTISSATLATDGKTLTVNIGGVSGTLSPATGTTGFTVKLSTIPLKQSSVTSSGSAVTINLSSVVLSGETITVSLSASPTSNLADTGGNTPQGQTNVAVTNSSSQIGAYVGANNASLYFLGKWNQTTGSHNYKLTSGTNSRFDTVVNGTDADAKVFDGTYNISIDEGAPTVITTAVGWTWIPLFSGLSNGPHTVKITGTGLYIDTDNSVRVVAPSGAGVSTPTGYGTYLPILSAPFSTYSQLDGSPTTTSGNGYNSAYWSSCDAGVRFNASVTDLWLWGFMQSSNKLVVYQDGVEISSATPTVGTWGLTHVASGLDGQPHTYEIVPIEITENSAFYFYAVMLGGGTGLDSSQPALRQTIAWYGDSIITEKSVGLVDSQQGSAWLVAHALGLAASREGNWGQNVSTYLRDNTSQVTNLSPKPKVVILEGGVNDETNGISIGNVNTAGTFAGDMKTMISNVAAGLTSASTIIVRGILPTTWVNYANRPQYVAAQEAAVNAYMATSPTVPVYFVSTDNWIDPATDTWNDGLHPSAIGFAKIANREIPLIDGIVNGSSYTVTGPSAGSSGQASTDFTLTLPGGATFTGDQIITLNDSSNGGTFTPSVGSSGVSSVVVTPTSGLTSFTFTYTPASAGAKSISFANGQTWTNPSSVSYTASDPVVVPTVTISAGQATSSLAQTSVTLSATTISDGGASTTDRGFFYGTSSAYGSVASTTSTQGAGAFSQNLTGLTCNTTYHFIAFAQNSAGTGTSTPDQSFTTSACPSSAKAITGFTIANQVGDTTINETAHTIAFTMPYGTAVTALAPAITYTGASILPASGVAHDFSAPVTYRVTAADALYQDYTVTVTVASDSTAPTVTGFTIPATTSSLTVDITTFAATDVGGGVTGYKLTDSNTPPAAGENGWTDSSPTTYTFATAGAHTLYAWAKDAAGNVSTGAIANVTVTLVTSGGGQPYILLIKSFPPIALTSNTTVVPPGQDSLVKYQNDPKVYLIQDGQKRWIVDEKVFVANGFKWNAITTIDNSVRYPDGENFMTRPAPTIQKFKSYLRHGSIGEEVSRLQTLLKKLGYFAYPKITNYFGPVTRDALIKFQKKYNLKPAAGYIGPATLERLNSILSTE